MEDSQKQISRIQLFLDVVVIVVSYLLAWWIQFELVVDENIGRLPFEVYAAVLLFLIPGLLFLYYAFNLYTSKRVEGRRLEIGNIIKANTIMILVALAVFFLIKDPILNFSRNLMFIFYGLNIVLDSIVRNLVRMALIRLWKRGINVRQMVLVGYSRAAEEYIDRIRCQSRMGICGCGAFWMIMWSREEPFIKALRLSGRIDNLNVILPFDTLDEIAITLGLDEYHKLEYIVNMCEKSGVHTKFIPDYNNIIPTKPYTEDIQGLPVINIRHVPLK